MNATLLGQTLDGRYRLDAPLGAGAMGEVYRGMQVSLMRQVAVKILPSRLAAQQDLVQRFEREAQLLSRLKHPGIVSVIDFGWAWGHRPYLVMELVEGQTLEQVLGDDKRLPPERVARMMINLCEALDHAHAMGVLHRDLKPSNILIEDTKVRVVDFGVARALEHGNANITGEGMVLGTPKYCSPEQAMGLALDGRSDLYALGVVGWRMLAGKVPFDGDGAAAIFSQHVLQLPPPLAQVAGLTGEWKALGAVIDRLLAKSPGDRYASAVETIRALEQVLGVPATGEPPRVTISADPPPPEAVGLDRPRGDGTAPARPLPVTRVDAPPDARASDPQLRAAGGAHDPLARADDALRPSDPSRPIGAVRPSDPSRPIGAALQAAPRQATAFAPTRLSVDKDKDNARAGDDDDAPPTHLDGLPGALLADARAKTHVRDGDDDDHDTLLDDIIRARHDHALDDSGFGDTARSGAPPAPAAPRSWLDRHPGIAVAGVVAAIALAAWLATSLSGPAPASRITAPLPPLAQEARALIEKGDPKSAIARLEDAVEKQPKDPALRVALAHAYVRGGRADDAVPHYVWAAKKSPLVFDEEHAGDLVTLANATSSPLVKLDLVRATERLGERADVIGAARAVLESPKCDDRKAAIKALREREKSDAIPLLAPIAKSTGCGAAEAKKAVEALEARP